MTRAAGAGSGLDHPWPDPPAPGTATELAEGVLWMRLPLPWALDHVNVYALDDGPGWTLVDTGLDTARNRDLWGELLAGPLAGRPVHRVLVTHHHPDHVGLAGWFQAQGAELLMPRLAWTLARMLRLDVQDRTPAEAVTFWRRAGMDPDLLAARERDRPFNSADCVAPMPLGFTRIDEGDRLTMGGRRWTLHLGQGHAADHATLWQEDGPLVLAGDQVLPGISSNIGVHATEPEADPLGDWLAACTRFGTLARPDHLVLPGHRLPFRGLPLRLRQLIENHHGALDRLRAHLDQPRRGGDCLTALFRREIRPGEYGLALSEALAHLNYLWHRGEATRTLAPDGSWLWQRA